MYTQEVADRICEQLAEGKSLRAVCRADGMPNASTVLRWLEDEDKADFAQQYAAARTRGYQLLADEILEIADQTEFDTIAGDEKHEERPNTEWITRSRLRVDSRKWMLSKMLPKVYGERQVIAGDPDAPLQMRTKVELDFEAIRARVG